MCGICGVWLRDGEASPETVVRMRDSIAHRGPDGASGVLLSSIGKDPLAFRDEPPDPELIGSYDIGLGHRRLAIIDLARGSQPMASKDRTVWLVYNGEIYNYRELRQQLASRGHEFETESDTEVLLRAYEEYGTDCPAYLNGIFAFAIWDGTTRSLFLARDQYGVKPVYYAQASAEFVFGSEVKAVLASGLVSPDLDVDALGLALTFRYTPSPSTLFRGVKKLAPGSCLLVDQNMKPRVWFFDHGLAARAEQRTHLWAATLATGIDQAVHRQMVSDVPIGLSLSSGIDSTTLLAVMSRWSPEPIRTFTIDFAGPGREDEGTLAERVAARYRARFQASRITADEYSEFMNQYMWHMEEPVGNESAPAYYFVAEMAREAGVKVLLTGQGPDELFAGYDRHVGIAFARVLRLAGTPLARALASRLGGGRAIGEKHERLMASLSSRDLTEQLLGAYTVFSRADARVLLRPDVYGAIDWSQPAAHVEDWLKRAPRGTPLEQMLWIDARTLLSDNLLLAEDKMAMAASVEARVPFLDVEFARLAESIPGSMKLRLGRRKHVYRQACARWIGPGASRRRKIGFANPMAAWFRGSYQDSVIASLGDPGSFLGTYAQPATVHQMVREHRDGLRDHTRKLYFLASLEAWHATFFT